MSKAMVRQCFAALAMALTSLSVAADEPATPTPASSQSASLAGPFQWKSSGVVIKPVSDDAHQLVSVKDPTVVYYGDRWHVFATTANTQGNWSMVYLSFKDWSEASNAKPYYMDANPNLTGYHCAAGVLFPTAQEVVLDFPVAAAAVLDDGRPFQTGDLDETAGLFRLQAVEYATVMD